MEKILEKYKTIENYLLAEKLNFGSLPAHQHVIVLANEFPYSVEPGIQHILLWSQAPLKTVHVQNLLEEQFKSTVWDWVYFVNPPETQSVRGLPHVHVFMRPVERE
ncbi:hypothetical protein BDF14DRAFT_1755823 [Spinellus fusiger]|nr:hypothetical protein BDF14DRAFT_1755823 [Spinellus fusiger]